jgi:hypothetical protein
MKTFIFNICVLLLVCFLSTGELFAQPTIITLSKADTSGSLIVRDSTNATLMKLNADGGFCIFGNTTTGTIPATGIGTRLMWYPANRAFRAGYVGGTQWDEANIGNYSTAMGYSTTASGNYSTAIGYNTTASGNYSTAMGSMTTASGPRSIATGYSTTAGGAMSIAMGNLTTASGDNSTAMGNSTTASGVFSTAMGIYTTASGNVSTAMGEGTTASGTSSTATGGYTTASRYASTAMGYYTIAGGDNSTAMGSYVKANHYGVFIIGDYSKPTYDSSSTTNEMTMRFANGYRLFTNSGCTAGATLVAGGSSWGTVSDSTKKINFEKADGEYFLNNLSRLKLGSWNYKSQDANTFRHYGPMAQEIFHYFGKDSYGTIGNDTTLTTADMDGIMMICLQALEKRTAELQKANEQISLMVQQNNEQKIINNNLKERIEKLEQIIAITVKNTGQLISNK